MTSINLPSIMECHWWVLLPLLKCTNECIYIYIYIWANEWQLYISAILFGHFWGHLPDTTLPKFSSKSPWKVTDCPNRKPDRLPVPPLFRVYVKLRGVYPSKTNTNMAMGKPTNFKMYLHFEDKKKQHFFLWPEIVIICPDVYTESNPADAWRAFARSHGGHQFSEEATYVALVSLVKVIQRGHFFHMKSSSCSNWVTQVHIYIYICK